MARRTPAKRNKSRQATNNKNTLSQTLEKEFSELPAKLYAQFSKEAIALRQAESKLKINIAKLKAQIQKQSNKAKAAAATKSLINMNKELQATSKQLANTVLKQTRASALRKQLAVFNKDWAKQQQALIAKAAAKAKQAAAKKPAKAAKKKAAPIIP